MKNRRVWIILGAVLVVVVAAGAGGWVYHEEPEFCATCHIMQPYLDSWNEAESLAGTHAQAEVDCLECHEPTIQQQVDELAKFVTGDYLSPLQEREFEDEWCLRCHEHGSVEQVAELTAELDPNPHVVGHHGELECNTCHNMHRASEDHCAQCHDSVVTTTGWMTPTQVIEWFDADMDCTLCHLMVPCVEGLDDPMLPAYDHAEEDLGCLDCNESETMEVVHAMADATATWVRPREVESALCLDCHVPNEHSTWQQLVERTADYVYEGETLNPHDPHGTLEETGEAEFECRSCHEIHGESRGMNYCYSCHHSMTFDVCSTCHS